ncbi:MAG TPA: hypothetical protein VEX38_03310 [Fimbriimonadaceae bacterium]|nr:hypothetical protein [Fimbriimonadaceae bacterium]
MGEIERIHPSAATYGAGNTFHQSVERQRDERSRHHSREPEGDVIELHEEASEEMPPVTHAPPPAEETRLDIAI